MVAVLGIVSWGGGAAMVVASTVMLMVGALLALAWTVLTVH